MEILYNLLKRALLVRYLWANFLFFFATVTAFPNGTVLDLVPVLAPVLSSHSISRVPTQ